MRAGGMRAERQSRVHRGGNRVAADATDITGRVDAGPTLTLHVPLAFRQRRGRKVLVAPDGAGQGLRRESPLPIGGQRETTSAVRAFARAFRWRKLLETGAVATVHEIAAAESINSSYVSRVLRLTLLSPEIVETWVLCEEDNSVPLSWLVLPFSIVWEEQQLSDTGPAYQSRARARGQGPLVILSRS